MGICTAFAVRALGGVVSPGTPRRRGSRRLRAIFRVVHPGDSRPRTRVRFGELWVDSLTFAEALDEIEALVVAGRGGSVFTPNVDHVVNVDASPSFRDAYAAASLSLADGQPLVWTSRLLGAPLPEKISGSDLVLPLMERAAARGWRVYLLGGGKGVAEKAAEVLSARFGVTIVGCDAPMVSLEPNPAQDGALIERIREAKPELLLVALGAPKQELWLHRVGPRIRPAVGIGVGAALDFVAGARRAPRWMSRAGLEWLFRLFQEPRRMSRRYLLNDPKFLLILYRTLRTPREQRLRTEIR
jgi:N-acetylglucosaminyldiphosphoundecaprenol N-acetyl-beta-D-mannosaminyltransferase